MKMEEEKRETRSAREGETVLIRMFSHQWDRLKDMSAYQLLSEDDLNDPAKFKCKWTHCGISFVERNDLILGANPFHFTYDLFGHVHAPASVIVTLARCNDLFLFWCPACRKPNALSHDASRRCPGPVPGKPLEFSLFRLDLLPAYI